MELIIARKLSLVEDKPDISPILTLSLTAEERTRSRYRWETPTQDIIFLKLVRGTALRDGDLLQAETGEIIQIIAKPEPVFTVTSPSSLELLRVAYHLGNRHVALEIQPTYLRLSPDSVLKTLLNQFNITLTEETTPFQPEIGAYHSH